MKKLFSLPTLYVIIWALYYTQGTILPQGSIWSRMIVVVFLLISIYYVLYSFIKFRINPYLKVLAVLLLMFSVYGMVLFLRGGSFDYLKMIYLSLLPTYSFYVWTKKNRIDAGWIKVMFFIMVGVVVLQYISEMSRIEENYKETESATINIAYEVLALLPLLFFWKKRPLIQYIMLAVILAVVLSTVKRGAIIIGAICTLYIVLVSIRNSSRRIKWYVWLIVVIFFVIGTRYVLDFYANSEYAQMRMENTLEGDSSGRDMIFTRAWNIFLDSNILTILFGHGANATIAKMGIAAHNDWLEL